MEKAPLPSSDLEPHRLSSVATDANPEWNAPENHGGSFLYGGAWRLDLTQQR
jgi:hypothetical protein